MNARVTKLRRDPRTVAHLENPLWRGVVHLALVALLWLPATWANAQDACGDPILDKMLHRSSVSECQHPEEYLKACGERGRYVREARECIAWAEAKGCLDRRKVVDFERRFKGGRFAAEARACIERLDRGERIERMLMVCHQHFEQGRITSGSPDNALDCFGRLLEEDRGNLGVIAGIEKIRSYLAQAANDALDKENVEVAEQSITELKRLGPQHRVVRQLQARLAQIKEERLRRDRLRQARDDLEQRVKDLIEARKYQEALAAIEKGRRDGIIAGKEFAHLEKAAKDGLEHERAQQARNDLERSVGDLIAKGHYEEALAAIEKGRRDGTIAGKELAHLEEQAKERLDAEKTRQARDAALAEARRALAAGRFDAAEAKLEEARQLGLPDERFRRELAAIKEARRKANEREELALLLNECQTHLDDVREREALACFRKVLRIDPEHAAARTQILLLEMYVAWSATDDAGTVERYYAFERTYQERMEEFDRARLGTHAKHLIRLARVKLESLHDEYWETVRARDTQQAYERYLEIFPDGRHAAEARERRTRSE